MLRHGSFRAATRFASSPQPLKIQLRLRSRRVGIPTGSPLSQCYSTLQLQLRTQVGGRHASILRQSATSFLKRSISTKPLPQRRGPLFRFIYRSFAYAGGFILVTGGLVVAFFIYDASTYREDLSFSDIPVSEKALKPRRGGPKNLPIAEEFVDDDDSPAMANLKHKPKLVILGSGWGSVAMLKVLNPEDYHITVVSPVNYFLFTPMLPSATVGTLELRSLVEPIRRIVQRVRGHFLKAEAVAVEFSEKLLEVSQTDASGKQQNFYLPYDKLVIGVGGYNLLLRVLLWC